MGVSVRTILPVANFGLPWRKIRIGLETESQVRPLVWVDCVDDNISWGPLHRRPPAGRVYPASEGGDFELIDDHDDPRRRNFHVSYHESGEYHVVRGWVDGQRYWLPDPRTVAAPLLIGALLTAHGDTYPVTQRSLERKKGRSVKIATSRELLDQRHYFDFAITPEGEFDLPEPLLAIGAGYESRTTFVVAQISERNGILIRHVTLAENPPDDLGVDAEMWVTLSPAQSAKESVCDG
jgi:hypothetical protein